MPVVGYMDVASRSETAADFEWSIHGFPTETFKRRWWLQSPSCDFMGMEWRLSFRKMDDVGSRCRIILVPLKYIGNSHFSVQVDYWLGVWRAEGMYEKIASGRVKHEYHLDWPPPLEYRHHHHECRSRLNYSWLPYQELERQLESLAPSGTIKFVIRLQKGPETDNEMSSSNTRREPTSSTEARIQSGVDDKEMSSLNPKKEQTSSTEAKIQTGLDETHFLIEHYRNLLLHADDHDVVIKVKGTEFKAHKNVLRVRSPVFQGMFKHNMKENIEDSVIIDDINPDCFGDFLMYVYTGKVENLSAANAIGLYYAGDKYDFPLLKTRCVDVLKASLSISIVCDAISIAITHGEDELLESGMAYVTCHLEELMETPKWQQFLLSNPLQANEISLKALKRRRTSSLQK